MASGFAMKMIQRTTIFMETLIIIWFYNKQRVNKFKG